MRKKRQRARSKDLGVEKMLEKRSLRGPIGKVIQLHKRVKALERKALSESSSREEWET